ncbi:Aquaporin-1 [Ascochyta clinopodiicola]|nr:Aquaporin-1 [Ascochyta clinopodiicola]
MSNVNQIHESSFWRRLLRYFNRMPVLPSHQKELSLTTSRGEIYLINQFKERLPLPIRNRAIAMLSEFVGTFFFMFIGLAGNSVVVNDAAVAQQWAGGELGANPSKLLFTAMVWGMSVIVNAWAFFRISGGLFNPSVTMAMIIIRAVPPIDGLCDMVAQLVASILASAICFALLPAGALATTELGSQTTITQGLFIETLLTAQLVIAVFMLAAEKHKATYIAPVGIGLGAAYTGASLNPARSFAVNVVNGRFQGYHWIYWVGPSLGALLATGFYLLIRKLEYWTVDSGADSYQSKIGEELIALQEKNK